MPRGCYCRLDGFFNAWHLRGAPDCVAAETDGQLSLFALEVNR